MPESSRVDLAESEPPEDFLSPAAAVPAVDDSDVYVAEASLPDSAVEIGSSAEVVSLDSDVELGGTVSADAAEDSSTSSLASPAPPCSTVPSPVSIWRGGDYRGCLFRR